MYAQVAQVIKNPVANEQEAGRRHRFNPWVRKTLWRRE